MTKHALSHRNSFAAFFLLALLCAWPADAHKAATVTVNPASLEILGMEPNVASQYAADIDAQKPFYAMPRAKNSQQTASREISAPPLQKPKSGLNQKLNFAKSATAGRNKNQRMPAKFAPMAQSSAPSLPNRFIASIGSPTGLRADGIEPGASRMNLTVRQPSAFRAGDVVAQIPFARGDSDLSDKSLALVKKAGADLKSDPRIAAELQSYAAGDKNDPSRARRTSLSRAIEVRNALIGMGVSGSRLGVKPLGTPSDGPADRVDIVVGR